MKESISRADARSIGVLRYYTGKPCKRGHISERFVSNACCAQCKQEDNDALRPEPNRPRRKYTKRGSSDVLSRKERARIRYQENKERMMAQVRLWRRAHPQAKRVIDQNRRAKKVVGGRLSPDLPSTLLMLQRSRCACCGEKFGSAGYHLDHVIPLALGGVHADTNIQLLCPPCNGRKHAKHPIDFMQSLGFLL